MKKIIQEELRSELATTIRRQIELLMRLQALDPGQLLRRPAPGQWCIVQVLEHLNSYGDFYLPEITKAINAASATRGFYKPGWLGNYFVKLIQPGPDGKPRRKMKAIKRHQPSFHADTRPVLQRCLQQQHELLKLLDQAREKDWGSSRTAVSLSKMLHIKLGDCIRFVVAHQERHLMPLMDRFG